MTAALAPYRVVDLTDHRGWFTARMLADLGADVIKVEPPGGDPGRGLGRTAGDTGRPADSLRWWFQNRNKRSVELDLTAPEDRARLLALVDGADVVVESFDPGHLEALELGPEAMLVRHPGLVVTSITPFGRTGPLAGHKGTDLVLAARSGMMWLTGDRDRAPLRISVPQLFLHGAAEAAVATVMALHHAARTGVGQHVDVSAQLAGIRTLMNATGYPPLEGFDVHRNGTLSAYSAARLRMIMPAADGHMALLPAAGRIGGPMMNDLMADAAALSDPPEIVADVDFVEADFAEIARRDDAREFFDTVSDRIASYMATRTKADLYDEALERLYLMAPVNTVADLRDDEQLAARGYFVPVDRADHGTAVEPGAWARLSATPLVAPRRAPDVGEHTAEVLAEARRVPTAPDPVDAPPSRIFEGLKVWDMSWVGVGPLTARYLADHGATVVRLDTSTRPDVLRVAPPFRDGVPGINNSGFYADFNCSKLGLGLNLGDERGRDIARRLTGWADVVVESFTPRNMAGWGLAYDDLRVINPSLVMLSTCMQGQTGPRANYRGFGNLMAALCGFYAVTGWADRWPVMVYGAYTDFICQRFCATALISALDHRARTGEGQHIDLAQFEAALQFLGVELLDHEVNGRVAPRMGNDDLDMAPHGAYPCRPGGGAGEAWVAIAVDDDAAWAALVDAMGRPAWALEPELADAAGRLAARRRLDEHLADWTRDLPVGDVVDRLQPRVAAAPVLDQSGLYDDPQIRHRGYFVELDHTVMGRHPYDGLQADLSATPGRLTKAAPCLGEDSWTVLTELLGIDPDEVAALIADGVVEMTG